MQNELQDFKAHKYAMNTEKLRKTQKPLLSNISAIR